jgi:hypothetical protein
MEAENDIVGDRIAALHRQHVDIGMHTFNESVRVMIRDRVRDAYLQ